MKFNFTIPTLFIAFAILTIFSCKDEDITAANRAKMVGTWSAVTFSQANCTDETENFDSTFGENGYCTSFAEFTETCITTNVIMQEDGNISGNTIAITTAVGVVVDETTIPMTGTWEVIDETTMRTCLNDVCSTGEYVITNTTLNYSGTSTDSGCDVKLTAEKQ